VRQGFAPPSLVFLTLALYAQSSDFERGVAAFQRQDYAQAAELLARAAEAQPKNAQVWKVLGASYAALEEYGKSVEPFRRACELDPRLPDACYYYGRSLYALDRYDESLRVFEHAAVRSWRISMGIGQALEALGRPDEAERHLRQALTEAGGADPRPGVALGLFLVRQGRFEQAIPTLEEVLKRFPEDGDAHIYLGRALLEQGRVDDAVPHLQRGVAIWPASSQAHLLLAKALARSGRALEAQEHFAAAARLQAKAQGSR
jgi:tetratricopeptide (TPR) repeat protein